MRTQIHSIPLGFDTCYVLRHEGTVAIDAGQPRKGQAFLAGLRRAGIRPGEVKLILLTHAHWDHMGSAGEIKAATGAPLVVHSSEVAWVENGSPPLSPGVTLWGKLLKAAHNVFMPFIDVPGTSVDLLIDVEELSLDDFGIPGVVLHTPGHSPGSLSVVLESGEAFVGDLAMNRLPLRMTPGLPIFAQDFSQVLSSWRRILDHGATQVFPAHGGPFPASVIRKALDH